MEYRYLGKSGLNVSALSLGSWINFGTKVNEDIAIDLIKLAYDNGVNFFDNAESYEKGVSELIMGNALKKLCLPRDGYCLSSKVFLGGDLPTQKGLNAKHIRDGCHNSLRRLQVDYLDLFFCHRPDFNTPLEETIWAMNNLIQQGKVIYWGTSEWPVHQITRAIEIAKRYNLIPPITEQPQYNVFNRKKMESEYTTLFLKYKYGATTWSPLASGLLTGKYNNGVPEDSRMKLSKYSFLKKQLLDSAIGQKNIKKARKLLPIADSLNCSLAQLSIAWCIINHNVSTVILGASNIKQLEENLKSLDVTKKLKKDVIDSIETVLNNTGIDEDFMV